MGNVEIPKWLKGLPLAPEFRPTDTEFADPIAYISKIEKEASAYGICKVIPPLPKPSKKYVFSNLNKSLSRTRDLGLDVNFKEAVDLSKRVSQDKRSDNESRAVFTTRQQELGTDSKRSKGTVDALQPVAQKQVWQSGEFYTLEQFESKSKAFSRSVLGTIKDVTPLVIEALFWKATSEKPIYVEYANDVPGSGFGEPEGLLRYSCSRKRRRRVCAQSQRGKSYTYWDQPDTGVEVEALGPTSCSFAELGKECIDPSTSSSNETSQSAKQVDLCANAEVEGTAGWKLSNCPWNLQVIARSAGSLTRFMLDDIPGVTSPMVYIGMLFSWFAWHVEDHELHSMNFLHTGSPKTWYAVPGDYAFAFEDVIRNQAYGGDVDHLAALKRLGEKTTLLSPELVAASGIPCCRLVQNPGEFVVTFPRAYHVGFSQGFNCGEAANFGTPQWLTIAKEAAVRRAAMDYLPMLSHQQLLYLLTMSFISRVPCTLLPSARNSRLKNRLKDERELLVKKSFIEDILQENLLVNTLLGKNPAFRAVLWHPDSLPSLARDSLSSARTMFDGEPSIPSYKGTNQDIHHLISDGKTLNDLYMDSNDLLCEFQVDSGTLVCVACGILGYPIMSVVQPSKKASMQNFPAENVSAAGALDISYQPDLCTKISFSETNNDGTWDTSAFMRPRIFCMEHAVQIEELLRSKGGAKMIVICHSDYQKIKVNATAIAEELKMTFNYKEVQFNSASKEELSLIDMAIDNEQHTDFDDWTSKLGINLQCSVKRRKGCLPKKIEHALHIDYLLSLMCPVSRISNIKWCSRKSRTKREPNSKMLANYGDGNLCKKDERIHVSNTKENKGNILLQYYRKKYRDNSRNFTGASFTPGCSIAYDAECGKIIDSDELDNSQTLCFKKAGADSEDFDTHAKSFVAHEEAVSPEANMDSASNRTSDVLVLNEALTSTSIFLNLLRTARMGKQSIMANENLHTEDRFTPDVAMPDTGEASTATRKIRCESDTTIMCAPEDLEGELAGSLVLGKTRFRHDVDALADFSVTENLGESETCKRDSFSTCTESIITVEEDKPVLANDSLDYGFQMGVQASSSSYKLEDKGKSLADAKMTPRDESGRMKIVELQMKAHNNFIRSPCEGLRPRKNKYDSIHTVEDNVPEVTDDKPPIKKYKKSSGSSVSCNQGRDNKTAYRCSIEGCQIHFSTNSELSLHKHNKCHHKECGKKFRSHKYVVLHQRVHGDERPLKCTWAGCAMTFKWAWARTEHLRLHTGERPYQCKVKGCGLTFRFVSDFSRHRRKTGHHVNQPPK